MSQALINLLAPAYAALLSEDCPFSEAVAYDQPGFESFSLRVIWAEQSGQPTTAWLSLAAFPVVNNERLQPRKDGDTITRGGKMYHVVDIARDGTGGATLELRCRGTA
jgi:hypothetical protein